MAAPLEQINLGKVTVLIVDNNHRARRILEDIATCVGFGGIVTAASAIDAKQVLCAQRIDLVLTDARPPAYDGYELTRWIRARPLDLDRMVPVVAVSPSVRRNDLRLGRDSGVDYILSKPISPSVLLTRLQWLTHRDRPFVVSRAYTGPDRRSALPVSNCRPLPRRRAGDRPSLTRSSALNSDKAIAGTPA